MLSMITNFYKVLCHIRVHICIGWAERAQIPKYIFEFNSRNEHLKWGRPRPKVIGRRTRNVSPPDDGIFIYKI